MTEKLELQEIFELFFDEMPQSFEIINSSRGESDFREAVIAQWSDGRKYVLKLADNDFTFAERITAWRRCAEEHRKLGYYAPAIIFAKNSGFPTVEYKGRRCTAYVEEFAAYPCCKDDCLSLENTKAAAIMMAKIAALRLDFTEYPSGYCLFERFCESDKTDEVLEEALLWKSYADKLPQEFSAQTERIWERWLQNRAELEKLYGSLPTSVFQADVNPTNILVDDNGALVGVFDFNLCGKDTLVNYLFREFDHDKNAETILLALKAASTVYRFSDEEIAAMPLVFRCVRPLFTQYDDRLKNADGLERSEIQKILDEIEYLQTMEIDFAAACKG